MGQLVRCDRASTVGTLTLDSEHNRNALSARLQGELNMHLHELIEDDSIRVVVLTGAGKVFCSGADLGERLAGETAETAERQMVDTLGTLWNSPKPVLARLNGSARAGGLGLVGACDIAIAPRSATFGFAEVRIGVLPAVISVTCLPRLSPRGALELFMTGENLSAERAEEVGLINRAVPDEKLDDEIDRYVGMLLRGGPEALGMVKPMIRRATELPVSDGLEEMLALSKERFASAEAREGMLAFSEKRTPGWVP